MTPKKPAKKPAEPAPKKRYSSEAEAKWLMRLTVIALIVACWLQFDVNTNLSDSQDRAHANTVNSCQINNKKLRRAINQQVIAPIVAVLTLDGRLELADAFKPLPYANCHNLYPDEGAPQQPFYRPATLPPLITPDIFTPGAVPATEPTVPARSAPEHPSETPQRPPEGSNGLSGTTPPEPPSGAGAVPQPPAEPPSAVDGLCEILQSLKIPC